MQCDPGLATDIFYEYIYTKPTLVTLLGDVCASVSQTVAQSAHHWNLIQVSTIAIFEIISSPIQYQKVK